MIGNVTYFSYEEFISAQYNGKGEHYKLPSSGIEAILLQNE
jgi:hypothetical protein